MLEVRFWRALRITELGWWVSWRYLRYCFSCIVSITVHSSQFQIVELLFYVSTPLYFHYRRRNFNIFSNRGSNRARSVFWCYYKHNLLREWDRMGNWMQWRIMQTMYQYPSEWCSLWQLRNVYPRMLLTTRPRDIRSDMHWLVWGRVARRISRDQWKSILFSILYRHWVDWINAKWSIWHGTR